MKPSGGVEPVQDVTGSGKITMNSCPVGMGTVSDPPCAHCDTIESLFNENLLCENMAVPFGVLRLAAGM